MTHQQTGPARARRAAVMFVAALVLFAAGSVAAQGGSYAKRQRYPCWWFLSGRERDAYVAEARSLGLHGGAPDMGFPDAVNGYGTAIMRVPLSEMGPGVPHGTSVEIAPSPSSTAAPQALPGAAAPPSTPPVPVAPQNSPSGPIAPSAPSPPAVQYDPPPAVPSAPAPNLPLPPN
jgi:hypothetical protein